MRDYGSLEARDLPRKTARLGRIAAISFLAACALVALVVIHHQSRSALLAVSETQALAALKSSDELLSTSAISADATKLAQQMLASKHIAKNGHKLSAEQLRKQALKVEAMENARVQKAKKHLEVEEKKRAAVDKRVATLLAKAEAKETKKEIEAAADKQFEVAKQEAIQSAAKAIEQATIAKEVAVKVAEQKLGANHDKFIDLNPPNTPQRDNFSDLDPPIYKAKGQQAQADQAKPAKAQEQQAPAAKPVEQKTVKQQLGVNQDKFLNMNAPYYKEKDPFSDLDPPVYKSKMRKARKVNKVATRQQMAQAGEQQAEAKVDLLRKELAFAQKQAASAAKRVTQHLAETDESEAPSDRDPPEFYENYQPGMLGPMADSKWVPADHPEGHKDCKLHDIDCDEVWPWGKVALKDLPHEPPKRSGPLGDNLVGVFGQDDVVVPTEDSGLLAEAKPYVDQFDHWPVNSKKNKDLLYGRARYIISDKYLGVGDQYVPITKAEELNSKVSHKGQPLADLMFGSWEQGFHKPATKVVKKDLNMFDQPYRQHWSVAKGQGHQIFQYREPPAGPTLGEADDEE